MALLTILPTHCPVVTLVANPRSRFERSLDKGRVLLGLAAPLAE